MVPGRAAAAAAARETTSNVAWVKVMASLLRATTAALNVSEEELRDIARERAGSSAAAWSVCVSTMMIAWGL